MCFRPPELGDIKCPECGASISPVAKICLECGADVSELTEATRNSMFAGGGQDAPGVPAAPTTPPAPGMPAAPGAPGAPKPPAPPTA